MQGATGDPDPGGQFSERRLRDVAVHAPIAGVALDEIALNEALDPFFDDLRALCEASAMWAWGCTKIPGYGTSILAPRHQQQTTICACLWVGVESGGQLLRDFRTDGVVIQVPPCLEAREEEIGAQDEASASFSGISRTTIRPSR